MCRQLGNNQTHILIKRISDFRCNTYFIKDFLFANKKIFKKHINNLIIYILRISYLTFFIKLLQTVIKVVTIILLY